MTEFVGLRTRLNPGMAKAYREAHDAIWPEILEAQRMAGIKRYPIFRDGLDLFHAVEVHDFEAADAMLRQVPVDQRWQAEMAKFVVATDDENRPGATRLELVYDRPPADHAEKSFRPRASLRYRTDAGGAADEHVLGAQKRGGSRLTPTAERVPVKSGRR